MAEHTKGKLKTDGSYIFGNSIGGCQMEKEDFPIAQIRGWGHLQYLGEDKAIEIQEANAEHLVKCWNAFEEGGLVEKLVGALEGALKAMEEPAVQATGEWETGIFCGLEDRDITDRYEACMYGYERALEKVREWVLGDFEEILAEAKKCIEE
ncbi:hypothetical protein LCGC14_1317040 [marine sediment metagenome]|uniref:Uncharacterized protein n=1 Tax=marine sediment metagenome TaxID=412755 RepID=A0A0F9NMW4_9ZZZZ